MKTPNFFVASRKRNILTSIIMGILAASGCAGLPPLPLLVADPKAEFVTNPKSATDYYNRGQYYQARYRCSEAIPEYMHATTLDPTYENAYNMRAQCALAIHDYQTAEKDLTHLINIHPKQVLYYGLRRTARIYLEDIPKAIEDIDAQINLSPENFVTRSAKANILLDEAQYAQALREYRAAYNSIPRDETARTARAVVSTGIMYGMAGVLLDYQDSIKSAIRGAQIHDEWRNKINDQIEICQFLHQHSVNASMVPVIISPGMSRKEVLKSILISEKRVLQLDFPSDTNRFLLITVSRTGSMENRVLRVLVFIKDKLSLEKKILLKELQETPGVTGVKDIRPYTDMSKSDVKEILRKTDLIIYEDELQIITVTAWQAQNDKRVRLFKINDKGVVPLGPWSRRLW